MTTDMNTSIRASRFRVSRTRGALSGLLLIVLGAWAALVPMIGPYFNLAYTPAPNDAWHWTAARGWFEVLPGAAAFLGGVLLLMSASRVVTSFGGWLAAAAGAWLIVGPPLDSMLSIDLGTPDPTSSARMQSVESLLFFYGVGAAILFFAALALGRLSVVSVRDVRAAERRMAVVEASGDRTATGYDEQPQGDDVGRHGMRTDGTTTDGATTDGATTDGAPTDTTAYPAGERPPAWGDRSYAQTAPPPTEEER
jgi:hypothetical protein